IRIFSLVLLFCNGAFAQKATQLDSLIYQYYQANQPGVAVTVIHQSETVYTQRIGLANLEHQVPISDSTAFCLASVSKQFTAYLALLLAQEGKLDMQADIRDYLPELAELPYKITAVQLANHTHGLPNVSELVKVKGFGQADRLWHRDVVDMALRIASINFRPGENYQYNNTGYVLLAEIIERQTDMPFQEALEQYIFQPLGMTATLAESSPNQLVKNKAYSYALRNGEYYRYDSNIMTNGSAGIRTTIADMTIWAKHFQATFADSRSPFARMVENSVLNNGERLAYGLGLETKNYRGTRAVFHGGGTAGYRAYTLHLPEHNFSVVVLGNTNDYWPMKLAYEIVDLYLDKQLQPVPTPTAIIPELEPYTGTYQQIPGTYLQFATRNDSLFFSTLLAEWEVYLEPLAAHTFAYPFYPEARFVFTSDRVELYIANFAYEYPRAAPVLQHYAPEALTNFTGFYRNESLNTIYEILVEDGELVARHPINYDIKLRGLADDTFISQVHFFGQLRFQKDAVGQVTQFELSAQHMKGLVFQKL
ncbi:MAG: serine hydrolase domain-containing protein, partial [Bacteroidota bacterium]